MYSMYAVIIALSINKNIELCCDNFDWTCVGVPALVVLILSVLDRKGVTDIYGLVAIYRHDRSPRIADGD